MQQEIRDEIPHVVDIRKSFLERITDALHARPSVYTDAQPATKVFGYEICHPHKNDGSLHMILYPEDVRTVIEAGWGERHPISRASFWWLYYYFWFKQALINILSWTEVLSFLSQSQPSRPPVPENLAFVYAPRNEEEFEVVRSMMEAAVWWVTGTDLAELREQN